jgi:APA family basic amino acid/polyamine antiporter
VAIAALLALNLRGVVRSIRVAAVMVTIVIGILLLFVGLSGSRTIRSSAVESPLVEAQPLSVLAASALIFVAFAGYARITVLGEEVRNPARVIPRAVFGSFVIVVVLYATVALTVTAAAGAGVAIGPAALSDIAQSEVGPRLRSAVIIAAVLAAGAVLLSLLAGVGRTLFAMADSGDAPHVFAAVGQRSKVPYRAEIAAALGASIVVIFGGLVLALSISAVMILTYYAIAHLAAMRMGRRPGARGVLLAATPYLGLAGCGALAGSVLLG